MKNLFCERLSELKKEKGLTTIQLANAISYSKTVVYYWEKGQREPTSQALLALSNFFNCSIDFLLGKDDEFSQIANAKPNLTERESRLLKAFGTLSALEQDKLIADAEFYSMRNRSKFEPIKK